MNRGTYTVRLNGEKIGSYTGTIEPAFATCVTTTNGRKVVASWRMTRELAEAARFIPPVTEE